MPMFSHVFCDCSVSFHIAGMSLESLHPLNCNGLAQTVRLPRSMLNREETSIFVKMSAS